MSSNIDFSLDPLFAWYVVALGASGVLMLVLGAFSFGGGIKAGARVLIVLAGLGFLGYAYYMAFMFQGREYVLFYKVFILPVAIIFYGVKTIVERGNAKAAAQRATPQPAGYHPNAAPYNPNAPQPGAAVPPQAVPYQPAAQATPPVPPGQPVANNPYAQPAAPAQPGQQPPQ
ncbi:hypothetical protein [Kitasatospora sp. NPDC097643]|uniref:hypothetical protein n=1 Tax=Kitasatospora sp. NPDC097643 TaxID=3157230 RepID=UPI00331B9B22